MDHASTSHIDAETAHTKPRRKRWKWWLIGWLSFSALMTLILIWMLRSAPSYWAPPDVADPGVIELAELIESHITSQTTAVRNSDEPWILELTDEQVNAWLAVRLPMWLVNQGYDEELLKMVPHAMAHFSLDGLEIAAELKNEGVTQIVRLLYEMAPDPDGETLHLKLSAVYAGRLRMPMEMILNQAAARIGSDTAEVRRKIGAIKRIEAKLPLEDGRVVEVISVELGKGKAILQCRTRWNQSGG